MQDEGAFGGPKSTGFTLLHFGNGEAEGVAYVSRPSTAPCQVRASPSFSRRDLPLSELSCEQHWVCSGSTDLVEEKTAAQQQMRERNEKYESSSPAGTKISEGGAQDAEQKLPTAQEIPQWITLSPCSTRAPHEADFHMQPWRSTRCSRR